jgi:cell cycle arrest protein BUB2
MIRLLNSFVHENGDDGFRYLQGMNAISAPFLYCMGELDAHATFSRFVRVYCPTYWTPTMPGPRAACIVLDRCLGELDADLFTYLKAKNLIATVYAFPRNDDAAVDDRR